MSARSKIADKLVELLKTIDGPPTWNTNLYKEIYKQMKFWDEVDNYPSLFVNVGPEAREYLPGGMKWGYLSITVRIYVEEEDPESALEDIFEDIEKIVDENGHLEYETNKQIEDMKIMSITTDEGLLAPIGVGEITLQIMYGLDIPC